MTVRALKADGKAYRWWRATVSDITDDKVVLVTLPGTRVGGTERSWTTNHPVRTTYWYQRPYNLVESYRPDGSLRQLYVHIASKPHWRGRELVYTDHELDVVKRGDEPPRVVDVHEFNVAAEKYHYSPALQRRCWRAVDEALELIGWWSTLDLISPCPNLNPGGTLQQPQD